MAEAGGVGPGEGGQTALHRVNEGPIESSGAVVALPGMAAAHRDEASQRRTSPSRRQPPGAGALGAVVGPFTRTGSYYAQSWRDYLDGKPRELPIARPSIALAAHAFRDEIVLLGLRARRPVSDVHEFGRINAEVDGGTGLLRAARMAGQAGAVLRKTPTADRHHRPASEGPQAFLRAHRTSTAATPLARASPAGNGGWATRPTIASTH